MNWFENLNLRERLIVVALGLVVTAILTDLLALGPYREYRSALSRDLQQAREDLAWMKQAVGRLDTQNGADRSGIRGNIATYVDSLVTQLELKKQLQQMTPIERTSVRLRLSDVPFDRLMAFYSRLNAQIGIEEVRILPAGEPGLVDVSMVLINQAA